MRNRDLSVVQIPPRQLLSAKLHFSLPPCTSKSPSPFPRPPSCMKAPEEVHTAVITAITLALAVVALPVIHTFMEGDRPGRRRMMLAVTALTGAGVFAAPVVWPFTWYIVNEDKLKARCLTCPVWASTVGKKPPGVKCE